MAAKRSTTPAPPSVETPRAPGVAMSAIEDLAREIGEKFRPEKVILFGSYAYGEPTEDSDVDLLVVMPARNAVDQAARILRAIEHPPFPLDLIVRTPRQMTWRIEQGDWFLREVVGKGRVLYKSSHEGVGGEGRVRLVGSEPPVGDDRSRP